MAMSRLYMIVCGAILAGYAIMDKAFAYIGYKPLYIGEVFLAFSLFMVLAGAMSARVFNSPLAWIVTIFILWGAARTVPYVEDYGLLAIRDAVLWYYALFSLLVGGALLRGRHLGSVPRWYIKWLPWFLVLAPIFFMVSQKMTDSLPKFPNSKVGIIHMKPGDMGVHLAGAAAFLGLGLHRGILRAGEKFSQAKEFGMWMVWGIGVIAAGSRNRGGLMSVFLACAIVLLFKPMGRLNQVILPALIVVMLGLAFDVKVPMGGQRYFSVQQIIDNLQSVVGKSNKTELTGTASWRLEWWTKIVDETLAGEFFWGGRGYGPDLSAMHGFSDATGNRSPHNGHLTILARSGAPGLVLWLTFLVCVGCFLLQGYFRMRALGHNELANMNIWALAYMSAFMVNSSFDVYLEGPQGGIWFWAMMGFVIALTEEQRILYSRATAARRAAAATPVGRF